MRLLLFTILLITLVGCQTDTSLTGHWHLQAAGDGDSYVTNIDFLSDTTFLYNDQSPRWEGSLGYLDPIAQTMYWGGECMMGDWKYSIVSKNKVEIFDRRKKKLLGTLTRKPICSKPDDIFLESRFAIELPVFKEGIMEIGPSSLLRAIMVGPLKKKFQPSYPGSFHIALGDKIIAEKNESEMAFFDLQHEIKVRESDRRNLKVLIYHDKNTPLESLEPVLRHYAGRREYIYFAGLSRKDTDVQMIYRKENVCELLEKLNRIKR